MGLLLVKRCAFASAIACVFCLFAGAGRSVRADEPAAPVEPAPAEGTPRVVPVEGRRFDIREIQVQGNTVLAPGDIEKVLLFFVGENRSADDVDAARAALEKLYKQLGYRTVAVSIPKQTIADGVVLLQVNETKVGRAIVEGSAYTSISKVKKEVPSLAPGTVPNFNDVQRELVYANRLSTRRVTPALLPGQVPGTLDVSLNVNDDLPINAALGWNNEHSRGTTGQRAFASFSYNNLFQRGHSLSLFYMTAPERSDDGVTYSVSYRALLPDPSWSLDFSLLKVDSDIPLGNGVSSITDNRTLHVGASKQLHTTIENWFPSLSLGADYKDFVTTVVIRTAQDLNTDITPGKYVPINLSFSQTYAGERHRLESEIAAIFTTGTFGSGDKQLDDSRFYARGQSVYLRASLLDRITLPRGFSINAKISGQVADRPLLPAEKLSAGGTDTVRGYFESEATGDRGVLGNLELRLPSLPDLFASSKWASYLTELQPYLFVDAVRLTDHGPFLDNDSPRSATLISDGVGLSARLREYANLQLVFSRTERSAPFTLEANTNTPSGLGTPTHSGDNRVLFRFVGSF